MKRDIDNLLKQALSPDMTPDPRLDQRILDQRKEIIEMDTNRNTITDTRRDIAPLPGFSMSDTDGGSRRRPRLRARTAVAAAICGVLVVGSVSTYAAWRLLSAGEVVKEFGDLKLAEAFTGEDAVPVNESQTYGNYRITLLGSVSGENISDYLNHGSNRTFYLSSDGQYLSLDDDRLYTVVAIEHADGTPMPAASDDAYGDEAFFVSPYVKGLDPQDYNSLTLKGSYSELVIDGVQYRILETTNVELFADRGVYIGVNDGPFYKSDAFLYNEAAGEITRNESYPGLNALFTLPLDPAHADPAAAQAWLDAFDQAVQDASSDVSAGIVYSVTDGASGHGADSLPTQETVSVYGIDISAFQNWVSRISPDSRLVDQAALRELCAAIPQTVQICSVTDNAFFYSWDLDGLSASSGTLQMDYVFPEGSAPGTMVLIGCNSSLGGDESEEDTLRSAKLETALLNEDGTVTVAVYVPKEYLERYTN